MSTMTVRSTLDSSLDVSSVTGDNTKVNVQMTSGGTSIAATYSAAALLMAIHNAINTSD